MDFDASKLTLGELVDALTIVNLKIFMLVDKVIASPEDIASMTVGQLIELAKSGKKAQQLNTQRSQLKNAIDTLVGIGAKDVKL